MSIWSDWISATPAGPNRDWRRQRRPLGLEVRTLATHLRLSSGRARLSPCVITGSKRTLPKGASAIPPRTVPREYHPATPK
jgi:hypothetical protein